MSQTLPIVLVASVLAGGAGAVASSMLTSRPVIADADTEVGRADADLLDQLRTLSQQNRDLSERIAALEVESSLAPVGVANRTDAKSLTPSDLEGAVRDVLASMGGDEATPGSLKLENAVANVIERREEQERLEREQARAEQQARRLEDRLAKLQTDLGLDPSQVDSMREIYQNSETRRDELRNEMRTMRESGGSWEDMRTLMQDARNQTNTLIQGVLTPGQYQQYQESNMDDWGGGRGRGGDRGFGGGNGGGGRRGNR